MKQHEAFITGEGDNWYERNKGAELNYAMVDAITGLGIQPDSIFEVGCGNARYLGELVRYFGCSGTGCDPSAKAIDEGRKNFPALRLQILDAISGLYLENTSGRWHDFILFGFCLYLLDRQDVFRIVALVDEVLKDGGHIAIYDFYPLHPRKVPYKHKEGLYSYKMDYSALWLANPEYRLVHRQPTCRGEAISIIKKVGWS